MDICFVDVHYSYFSFVFRIRKFHTEVTFEGEMKRINAKILIEREIEKEKNTEANLIEASLTIIIQFLFIYVQT
jgi:hypothetical protein